MEINKKIIEELQELFDKILSDNSIKSRINLTADDAYNIARILKKTFVPLMSNPSYNSREEFKKEHQKTIEYVDKMYKKVDLHNNVTRIINKTTPSK